MGPGGPSQIYKEGAAFIKLSDYGIDVGTDGRASSGHDYDHGTLAFAKVGKTGLGDLDVSIDQTRLFTVDLNNKELIAVPINRDGTLPSGVTLASLNSVPTSTQIGHFFDSRWHRMFRSHVATVRP